MRKLQKKELVKARSVTLVSKTPEFSDKFNQFEHEKLENLSVENIVSMVDSITMNNPEQYNPIESKLKKRK